MKTKREIKPWQVAVSALFWVAVWQLASMAVGQALFLPSPLAVLRTLWGLAATPLFWRSIGFSLGRIGAGFLLGLLLGCVLAGLAASFRVAEVLLRPLMMLVKATPVASFVILALVWMSSRNLSVFISFLMVLPVIYTGALSGIRAADTQLLEMAKVFRISRWRRFRAIYLPALRPSLLAAAELGLGLCWKSGVAAEVIGLPRGSIGERLFQAKNFLLTVEVFGWTLVIILLSWLFGKLVLFLLRRVGAALSFGASALKIEGPAEQPPPPAGGPRTAAGKVTFANIYKSYAGQAVLLDFSARIAGGEHVAAMGPSGSGKTTLVRLLLGLERPDAGGISGRENLRFSCVFQEDRLCTDISALANAALVLPRAQWPALPAAFAAVGLAGPDLYKPAGELSGGQRRRVALVRALQCEAGFVVLDEAFNGLDEATKGLAHQYVAQAIGGRSLLVVTHDAREAEILAQRLIRLAPPVPPGASAP